MIPKQEKNHGLKLKSFELGNEVLEKIIDGYTRESGVRGLEKQIASVARHVAMQKVMFKKNLKKIDLDYLPTILGIERGEKEMYQGNDVAGVVTGLAWTSVGGEILFIESSLTQGTGKLQLTGQLGDVMKESARAALSYAKSHADELEIPVTMVLRWFIANGLSVKGQKDWTEDAKQRLLDDIFSPYETVNS